MPVGLAEPPEVGTEEATEDEDMMAEPNYTFAKGYGRFGVGYTRLATALGNFEQGSIEAESAIVAQWLTSGLRVAMARTGWHLLSPRLMLTKVPECVLNDYYHKGYPLTPKMTDRPYNQYGTQLILKNDGINSVHGSPGTPISGFNSRITSRRFETTWAIVKKPLAQVIKLAERSLRQNREAPRRQRGLPGTVGPPHRPRPMGGPMAGGSEIVGSGTHPDQQPSPSCSIPTRGGPLPTEHFMLHLRSGM